MSVKIKKIYIHAFRGIPDLELELEGKSLLLRGENGTGKSSIVDAIEFFFTGRVSHLEGVRGLSLQRHGPHVNFSQDDVNIEITFDPGKVSLSRTFDTVPSPPEQLEKYFQITQKGTFILRRSQILEFIMSQPAERFRAIGSIIGIESLDNTELGIKGLRDELKVKVESRQRQKEELFQDLSSIIGETILEVQEILPALNRKLQEYNLPSITSLEEADKYTEEMFKTLKIKVNSSDRARILKEISDMTKVSFIPEEIIDELNNLNEKVVSLLQDRAKAELSLVDMLETGKRVIERERMDICPLCEQKIDREKLLARIRQRLNTVRALSDEASEIRQISVSVTDNLKVLVDRLDSIISKIDQFEELSKEKEIIQESIDFLTKFIDKIIYARDLKNNIPIQEIIKHKNEINKIIASISTKCNQLLESAELTEEEKKVLEIVRLIEQVKQNAKAISRINSELKVYQKYYELTEKIYSAFSETKKAKIQEIYNSIQEDIQRFYSILHPNEPHRNIELIVALGRRASTELKIESFGRRGEDPRALTSEGHLDSLGLCIFLAFVKKFNEGCPLIILDDVVNTVDANHREKIAKLLLEEFNENQLIITTHDGIWYELMLSAQRAYDSQNKFKNMVIVDWNVDRGPKIMPYKPRWERIQHKISSGDKDGAGNECRKYLEWLLEEICEKLQVPIVFKRRGRYVVSELLDPAEKRIKKLLKDSVLKSKILYAFRELRRTIIMGNLLSHNNMLVEEVSMEEVKSFCQTVHELHKAFLCPSCGHFIGYYRNLKIARCSNPRCTNPIEVKTK
jgi:DNA repair exonuclease SbcCD ATPase subunit